MRFLILPFIALALVACDPGTPVGNILHPDKPRNMNLSAQNISHGPVTIKVLGTEYEDEWMCEPDSTGEQTYTLQTGEHKSIRADVKCPLGTFYRWSVSVQSANFSREYHVWAAHLRGQIQCDDTTCNVNLNCDGSACPDRTNSI